MLNTGRAYFIALPMSWKKGEVFKEKALETIGTAKRQEK